MTYSVPSELLEEALLEMDRAVVILASIVPPPQTIPFMDGWVFRHVEQMPQQAIVQKLARLPSGLRAARVLLQHGYFQEQAVLQRVVDEIGEDVLFLCLPLIFGSEEEIHRDYLQAFFTEEYDLSTGQPSSQDRPTIKRKKIRAYIARSEFGPADPNGHIAAARTLSKTYSGFVHAASPHIMDMYGGHPPRFQTAGMLGTIREFEYRNDIINYFYRSVTAFVVAARALGHEPQYRSLFDLFRRYEAAMELSYPIG